MNTMALRLVVLWTICVFMNTPFHPAQAESVRAASHAGAFYPEDPGDLEKTIGTLIRQAEKTTFHPPPGAHPLKALIVPHAGYPYSGLTAAHVSNVLKGLTFRRIVLMGPDHRVGFRGVSLTGFDAWKTPLGTVPVDPVTQRLRQKFPQRFTVVPVSDQNEHSLEVVLPFLQTCLSGFSLIPLVVSDDDPKALADDLASVISPDDGQSLWVASSDLSHYLPYDEAVRTDRDTLNLILKPDPDALVRKNNAACGRLPIACLMALAERYGWKPFLIHYSNSGDTEGDKQRVVGYAAIAYYGGFPMKTNTDQLSNRFTDDQGRVLINLARSTIAKKLGQPAEPVAIPDDPAFTSRRGTFVTLKIDHQLRGCIGNLSSDESVAEGIRRNALNAAFGDFRFSPLTEDELNAVDIEVSILTEPQILEHSGGRDLVSKLRPHIDGVIIRKGRAGATFLPQVWEQLPDAEDFLRHLCTKAGLPSDAWKSRDLEVSTYQVQYFEEETK